MTNHTHSDVLRRRHAHRCRVAMPNKNCLGGLALALCITGCADTNGDGSTTSSETPSGTSTTSETQSGASTTQTSSATQTTSGSETSTGTTSGTSGSIDCEVLDQQECADEPRCLAQRGDRLDQDQGCLYENEFAVCVAAEGCQGIVEAYVDPSGNCWLFGEVCLDEGNGMGWMLDPDFEACPELADWEVDPLPSC